MKGGVHRQVGEKEREMKGGIGRYVRNRDEGWHRQVGEKERDEGRHRQVGEKDGYT